MSRWLVTQNNAQFAVDDLDELKRLASAGELGAGDMIQPPGSGDWLYASEIPELQGLFQDAESSVGDDFSAFSGRGRKGLSVGVLALLAILLLGSVGTYVFYQRTQDGPQALIGDGGLTYSEMLVTEAGAALHQEAMADSHSVATLRKDERLQLLAKRGDFYHARTSSGQEGWVAIDAVLPMYLLGGGDVRDEYDPLYNPDRYVEVRNATWLQLDKKNAQLTVFRFMLQNEARYPMTDLVLLATIRDGKGNELERVEIPIEGMIPAGESTMVGTLAPDGTDPGADRRLLTNYTFQDMAETDPDLQLLYTDGVEVEVSAEDFTEASVDLLEVRAVPEAG